MEKKTLRVRTRTGCFGCRSRKRKCDGGQPQCSSCRKYGEQCRYGIKASFHPARNLQLSAADSVALLAFEETRGSLQEYGTRFVDDTKQIVRSYEGISSPLRDHTESSAILSETGRGSQEKPTGESQGTLDAFVARSPRPIFCATVIDAVSDNDGPQEGGASNPPNASVSSLVDLSCKEIDMSLSESAKLQLIGEYVQTTGTWFEITDSKRHFTVSSIRSLLRNEPFITAALALVSRQRDIMQGGKKESSMGLYQQAIQSLLHYEPSQCGEATLVCCVLLSTYDAMTSEADAWRRHLKGCVFNLMNKGWNGSSPALAGAAFWAFARMDIWAAYFLKDCTLVPPENWINEADRMPANSTLSADEHCNLITVTLAKVVNHLAQAVNGFASTSSESLWRDLQEWRKRCPHHMTPLLRREPDREHYFPQILFLGASSVCGYVYYHTGCILLLISGWTSKSESEFNIIDPVWHAKELCGISTSPVSHACLVNQVHPLYIAGLALGMGRDRVGEDRLAPEKRCLLSHLEKLEHATGWPTARIITMLKDSWAQ